MKRFLILFVLLLIPFQTASAGGQTAAFPDIPDLYAPEAGYMASKGMIRGMPDGNFLPAQPVKRADAAVLLGRALGFEDVPGAGFFQDVPATHYAAGYIEQAVDKGIIAGIGDGLYAPDAYLTRGQMSLLLERAFPALAQVHEAAYHDVPAGHYFHNGVMHISRSGVAGGFSDGTFRPGEPVTRIQMTLFLARTLNENFRVTPLPLPDQPRIAATNTAGDTDQILTVVHNGNGRATVTYWKKEHAVWKKIRTTTEGFVGINGVSASKREGDRNAPVGSFRMPFAFGTENPGTKMPFRPITNRSYWISNVHDPAYNTWQERSSSHRHDEHLIRYRDQYKYAMAIDYNMHDPIPGKGSAIFLHVSNGTPTLGCVSVPASMMRYFMQELGPNTGIIIVENEADIYNY